MIESFSFLFVKLLKSIYLFFLYETNRICGGIDITDEGLLLLLRRDTADWSNPGGKLRSGETQLDAVVREHREEVGVEVEVLYHIGTYIDRVGTSLLHIYPEPCALSAQGYKVHIVSGIPSLQEPEKHLALRRFPLDSLPRNLSPWTRFYLDVLLTSQKGFRFL